MLTLLDSDATKKNVFFYYASQFVRTCRTRFYVVRQRRQETVNKCLGTENVVRLVDAVVRL